MSDLRRIVKDARAAGFRSVAIDVDVLESLLDVVRAARKATASGDWNHRLKLDDALDRQYELTQDTS
jgi:hypothetical protein